jgi:hypothetical protein
VQGGRRGDPENADCARDSFSSSATTTEERSPGERDELSDPDPFLEAMLGGGEQGETS